MGADLSHLGVGRPGGNPKCNGTPCGCRGKPAMPYTALVPVKALNTAKSRLSPYLTQSQRETLVLDMLSHVLRVLLDSQLFARVSVVSPDMRVLEQAKAWGALPVREDYREHNPALHSAALKEQAAGATAILTISADLPLLCTGDIQAMIEQSQQYQVILAPAQAGTGTNAMLVRPPLALPYLFGPKSLQHHLQAAGQRELSTILYNSTGLALDIDTIDDLHLLPNLYPVASLTTPRGTTTPSTRGNEHSGDPCSRQVCARQVSCNTGIL